MKRSKMLELIDQYVLDALYDAGLSLEGAHGKDLADIILVGIEEAGMLPPESDDTDYCDCGCIRELEWEVE